MFTSRFSLELDSPTDSSAASETRLMLLGPALKRYHHCIKRESLGSDGMWDIGDGQIIGPVEMWTTEAGRVFVQPSSLSSLCQTLQIACSLQFRQIRVLYPDNGEIELSGLFDFLLLGAPLKVVIEVDSALRKHVEERMAQFEWEYRIPDFPRIPTPVGWVGRLLGTPTSKLDPGVEKGILDDARFLLQYAADRDPNRLGKALHRLRHLDDAPLCGKVLESHRGFYERGDFETHKDYPREGDGERVANYLSQLYQWAHTPGWISARKASTVPDVPLRWCPTPPNLKLLEGPPPRPQSTPCEDAALKDAPLDFGACLHNLDRPRLAELRQGVTTSYDYLLSNASYGELSGLAAVACAAELFGLDGAVALLKACRGSDDRSGQLARQWMKQVGHTQLKLDAYLQLREDQAEQLPIFDTAGADPASGALHAFLSDQQPLPPASPESVLERVTRHLNVALEHRLSLRIPKMSPAWLPLLRPLLGFPAGISQTKLDRTAGNFDSADMAVQKIHGNQVLALNDQMLVVHDSGNRLVSLWRPDRPGVQTFKTPAQWHWGVAYSVRQNLLLAVELDGDGSPDARLNITGLPVDTKPRSLSFPGGADKLMFCPQEKWLAAWGRQGWCVVTSGDFKDVRIRSRDLATQIGFDSKNRYMAVSHDQRVSLYEQESWTKLAHWDGFSVEEMTWSDDHLVVKSSSEVASLTLPALEQVGRLAVSNASLQSRWLMVSDGAEQKRFDYPTLRLGQTYALAGERSWLIQDGKVLLIARRREHLSSLLAFDSESYQQLACSPEVPVDLGLLKFSAEKRFAAAPGWVFSFGPGYNSLQPTP